MGKFFQRWRRTVGMMNRSRNYRIAGIATLLFAVCPSIELGLMTIADSLED